MELEKQRIIERESQRLREQEIAGKARAMPHKSPMDTHQEVIDAEVEKGVECMDHRMLFI